MSFTSINAFQHTAGYSVARPVPPTVTAAAFGTLTALGQIPITGIVYNSTTSYYNILVNGGTVATNQTASSYTYSGGLANNTQYGPFTVVPYTAAGVAGTAFTVTGGSGGGRIYTWAYAGTLSFSGTSSSGTTLNFTGQALSSVYITYTPTSGVTPVSGTKTSTLPVAFIGMTSGTTYTYTVYPVNGDNVPGSASGTNTGTGTVTTKPPTLWVAGGQGVTYPVAYSTNVINWTGVGAGVTSFGSKCVTIGYDPSRNVWVAGGVPGSGNTLAYSSNAITWTSLPTNVIIGATFCVHYNTVNNYWLAGGGQYGGNYIAYSTNALAWTKVTQTAFNSECRGLKFSISQRYWVGAGNANNTLGYSKDGMNWTGTGTSMFATEGQWVEYSESQSLWVSVGYSSTSVNTLAYSTNGISWNGLGKTVFATQGLAVAYSSAQDLWVAGGKGTNSLGYSKNGTTWTAIAGSATFFSTNCGSVAYSTVQDVWVAAGQGTGGALAYSKDGITWTAIPGTSLGNAGYGVACNQ